MKLKKLLSALAVSSVFAVGAANAAPIVINVNTWDTSPAAGTDGKTAPIAKLGMNWTATSTYTDTNGSGTLNVGDMVVDSGQGSVSYLNAANVQLSGIQNNEGLNFTHGMWFDYSNLLGVVAVNDGAGGIGAIYGSGTINVYGDINADTDLATNTGKGEDVLLMKLGVTGSTGTVGNFTLFTKVLSALPGVFFYNGTTDFNDILVALDITAEADFNNNPKAVTALGGSPLQWTRTTDLNGNLEFNVPEPGALALLGLGLFGLGAVRRSKKSA